MEQKKNKRTLAAIIGTTAGAIALFVSIPKEESGRDVAATIAPNGTLKLAAIAGPQYLHAYLDAVKVPTACDGITKGVKLGQTYTEAQCTGMLEEALMDHAAGVIACVPELYGREHQAPAAVSLAYNIGVPRFCASTAARMFRAKRWREGCNAFAMWNQAKGQVLAGLVARRRREAAECVIGLAA